MPNGTPGDAPWTDLFVHKRNIFPYDMEEMLWRIHEYDENLIRHLNYPDMWKWEKGENLEEGRQKLKKIIEENNVPKREII